MELYAYGYRHVNYSLPANIYVDAASIAYLLQFTYLHLLKFTYYLLQFTHLPSIVYLPAIVYLPTYLL